jgi:prepilin-type N-terminal cleavage/methylation domain-containing protein/prepilin-type processing-associated H-X9-DG protein
MYSRRSNRRRAFTLIELLIVVAIIAVLFGILLPAVQSTRESANRIKCGNNLRQVGLGLLKYQTTNKGQLPPSQLTVRSGVVHSWTALMLPYIEQGNVASLYKLDRNWNHADNQAAIRTSIITFACPSTPEKPQRGANGTAGAPAITDYVAVTQVSAELINHRPELVAQTRPPKNRGVMIPGAGAYFHDIYDGAANCLLIVEDAGRPSHYIRGRKRGPQPHDDGCGNANVPANGIISGAAWADPANDIPLHGFTNDGLRCTGPCALNCTNNNEPFAFHRNGMNAVFADGSVRYIRDGIDIRLFAALITMDGGEYVSGSDF